MSSDESFEFIVEDDIPVAYATAPPSGVLSVHIKLIRDIDKDHISVTEPELYVRIKVGSFIKNTQTVMVEKDARVVLDDLKHFSLKVSKKRSDPSNEVRFDLIVVESPHVHRIVGHKDMHLYDIIKNLFVAGSHDLKYRHKTISVMDLEMCFTYGIFGYGCCHQLQNRQKKICDIVGHSLLLRVEPPESRSQPNAGHVMTAMPVGHPEFINFSVKAEVGSSAADIRAESSTQSVLSGLEMQEPIILTRTMRKRLHRIQTDFAQQGSRVQRKKFLERLVLRHIHDHRAIETDPDAQPVVEAAGSSSAGPGAAKASSTEQVAVNAETYGTDSDYQESATDLSELLSSMLMNAPGLVGRTAVCRMRPSLLSIGEETADLDSTPSETQASHEEEKSHGESTDDPSFRAPSVKEERRRSTLTELPGLLVRSFANRLTAWRTTRSRSSQQPTVVVTDEGPISQSERERSVSESRFRSRMARQEEEWE